MNNIKKENVIIISDSDSDNYIENYIENKNNENINSNKINLINEPLIYSDNNNNKQYRKYFKTIEEFENKIYHVYNYIQNIYIYDNIQNINEFKNICKYVNYHFIQRRRHKNNDEKPEIEVYKLYLVKKFK